MKIQKETFYVTVILILVLAALMAYFFQPITDGFVIPVVLGYFEIDESPHLYQHYFTPDVSFLAFFIILGLIMLRIFQQVEPLVYVIYGASLFFCFFYLLIAPIEALIVMPAFFVPVFMWHQNDLGNLVLVGIAFVLIAASWAIFQKPAIFLLMLPMCHLLAIRASNSLQSRYSGKEKRVLSKLSTIQKSKVNKNHSLLKHDLWEIIGPEIQALADSWAKIKPGSEGASGNMGENDGSEDEHKPFRPRSILSSFIEIQDEKELIASIKALQKRDEHFTTNQFLTKFEQAFTKIQKAVYDHEIETIQQMVSDALYEQFRCRVDEQKDAGVKFECEKLEIVSHNIARVCSDKNFDEIHVMVSANVTEIARDLVSGDTLNADNKLQKICEYWSFIRKPSAKTLQKPGLMEGNCPNCGAPIQIGQATVCPVCNSFIRSGSYDWVLAKITQASEWEYANPKLVPGYKDIVAADSNFTIHQIEDRCAVVFWMLRLVERKQDLKPLRRFATAKCCESFSLFIRNARKYTFMENVSFASATLKAVSISKQCQKIYILVIWSGIPVTCTKEGRLPQFHRFNKPKRDVLVFVRKPGQKTNLDNTLSSAHCSSCGGPLSSSFAVTCNYCNAVLNDGSEWMLEKIISERAQEYVEMISQKRKLIKDAVEAAKKEKEEIKLNRSGRDVVSISAKMLMADGKIDDAEKELLHKLAARYEMDENLVNGILEAAKEGELYIPQPENRHEARAKMEAAVSMALADGLLAPGEQRYLESLGREMGYAQTDIRMMIKKEDRRIFEEQKAAKIKEQRAAANKKA